MSGRPVSSTLWCQMDKSYFQELCKAMTLIAEHPNSIIMGQSVRFPGTFMYKTLEHLPIEKRFELPVFENTQLGMAIGASLTGDLPVCVFPRINFLLEAMSQLISHLDKLPLYSDYKPKVIIRTAIASKRPLDPGVQHLGDYSDEIETMLTTVRVARLNRAESIVPSYEKALSNNWSTILIEYMDLYDK